MPHGTACTCGACQDCGVFSAAGVDAGTLEPKVTIPSWDKAKNTLESGLVSRYHAVPSVAPQTVGLHAWGVAVLILHLTEGDVSAELLKAALLHDQAELYTGDVPFTVKRDCPEIKPILARLEALAIDTYLLPYMGNLDGREMALLKTADTLEGLLWCRRTELTGPVKDRWIEALNRAVEKFSDVLGEAVIRRVINLVAH